MEMFAAIQRYTCPDYQDSISIMIDFSDTGLQVAGRWFFPYESAAKIYGKNQGVSLSHGVEVREVECHLKCRPHLSNHLSSVSLISTRSLT
ncbi:hypothetical protein TNCV_4010051 [Trichonephila clavipes]|nr:hypothetical protein TNCV_4010051 [Trichonephila clavipes]